MNPSYNIKFNLQDPQRDLLIDIILSELKMDVSERRMVNTIILNRCYYKSDVDNLNQLRSRWITYGLNTMKMYG